jgi:hypothetical protein
MSMRLAVLIPVTVIAIVAVPGFSEPAQAPKIVALQTIQSGQWALRSRSDPEQSRSLCLGDPALLLQLRHGAAACTRFVVASDPRSATVQYRCPGSGNGRTTIRVETPRLVQIQSQGIMNNEPFVVEFEGRRVGECAMRDGGSASR